MRANFRVILIGLLGVGGLLAGCSMGGIPVNYYLNLLIKDTGGDQFANTNGLIIRMANTNSGSFDEEVDLLISYRATDGSGRTTIEQITMICSAEEVLCDMRIEDCPVRVEALQERRYDLAGRLQGVRELSGVESFSFEEGEFECGGFVVYQFSESEYAAFAY